MIKVKLCKVFKNKNFVISFYSVNFKNKTTIKMKQKKKIIYLLWLKKIWINL